MNDSIDFEKEFASAKKYAGTSVVLVCASGGLEELRRIVGARADLAHVKIIAQSELDDLQGRKPTHIAVDEVAHLSFEVRTSFATMLYNMCQQPADDFKREYLGSFPSGGEPIADRLREVPVAQSEFVVSGDKIEPEIRAESRGKWKGRRAIERGWRR